MSIKTTAGDGHTLKWIKSSHSTNEGPECVEVAATPNTVLVRDSKNTAGPRLAFAPGAWDTFVAHTANH
ncbi:DUF397 domain-containing protein [Streptomyces armeniacus]|uniref:DUF397 domain-containing protein n=1 Tax=Streptomyces armeniacus TaxID=83291 RepID=A0A345XU14_9ACTN|nr:DUF397 domain-containing protein [Streptomyces armeniacus]AXK35130.1 DUF397 domain-containing protein [Streptomyces armeniacus]